MSQMTIQQIEIYKLFIPLKEPFIISLGPIYNAENDYRYGFNGQFPSLSVAKEGLTAKQDGVLIK